MSLAEILLILGTFGICTGVWVTLFVIIQQHKINQIDKRKQMAETAEYRKGYLEIEGVRVR